MPGSIQGSNLSRSVSEILDMALEAHTDSRYADNAVQEGGQVPGKTVRVYASK